MKKLALIFLFVTFSTLTIFAQSRTRISNDVSVVQYGDTWIIEDSYNKQSISMKIAQEGIDRKNNEKMYNVICNGSTKKVAQWALRGAIAAGIKGATASSGSSLLISASALAIDIIYDEACNYWKEKAGY